MVLGGKGLENYVPGSSSSGVLLQWPISTQYTSYRTGDEGWRNQNGYFNYTRPASPEVIAELDYSIGANYFWQLKTALTVGGVTSKTRFVDVNGVQTWGATNNVDCITIDKLTGIGFYRKNTITIGLDWNGHIDNALSFSVTVNGVTYSDWYMMSLQEYNLIFGNPNNFGVNDPISGARFMAESGAGYLLSTTTPGTSSICYVHDSYQYIFRIAKTNTSMKTHYIFDARSLITV